MVSAKLGREIRGKIGKMVANNVREHPKMVVLNYVWQNTFEKSAL